MIQEQNFFRRQLHQLGHTEDGPVAHTCGTGGKLGLQSLSQLSHIPIGVAAVHHGCATKFVDRIFTQIGDIGGHKTIQIGVGFFIEVGPA